MTHAEAIALLEDQMTYNRTMQRGWGNTMIETDAGKIVDGTLYANQHKDVADALELAINALRAGVKDMNVSTMSDGQPLTPEQLRGMDALKRKYEVAVQDLETIMFKGKENTDTCAYCRNDRCYGRGGRDCCNPIWRGRDNHAVTEKPCLIPYTGEP